MNRRTPGLLTAVVVSLALALTGCAPADESRELRDLVGQAAQQASEADYAGADATLLTAEQDVIAARDGGQLDSARADEILAAVAVVRADLTALLSPTPAPEPVPTPATPAPSDSPSAPAEQTSTPEDGDDDSGDDDGEDDSSGSNGNSNKGNNGNGNGNNKNKE